MPWDGVTRSSTPMCWTRGSRQDPAYYAGRYAETQVLRGELVHGLMGLAPMRITPGTANFVLCELDASGPTAAEVVGRCREHGVFLRDASAMGESLSAWALRIAVKDRADNARILDVLAETL